MIALHRTGRIQLFRIDGRPLGEDAIADERDFTHAVPVQGGLVVLNALGARQVPLPDRTGSRTEFVYLLYLLEADKGLRLGAVPVEIRVPGQRIDRILAIDGALAFTNGGETLVVPMPFGGDAGGAGVDPRPDSR
jgi:type IV secretory pathway protease TraF